MNELRIKQVDENEWEDGKAPMFVAQRVVDGTVEGAWPIHNLEDMMAPVAAMMREGFFNPQTVGTKLVDVCRGGYVRLGDRKSECVYMVCGPDPTGSILLAGPAGYYYTHSPHRKVFPATKEEFVSRLK